MKRESRYAYYLSLDRKEYRILRKADNVLVECVSLPTVAATLREAKKRVSYYERSEQESLPSPRLCHG